MKDITPILRQWPYEPEKITVRKITGDDGLEKVQMRLDLGLLQMESAGRPDGQRPQGFESLSEFHEYRLRLHAEEHGTTSGFKLSGDECAELRNEALQYYYRYLSLFHLEDYVGVERDTARNLRVFDLVNKYAEHEEDRLALERYRPYVLMMNARARANLSLRRNRPIESLHVVEETLDRIREFLREHDREDYFDQSGEVLYLKDLAEEIRKVLPRDPREDLRKRMQQAVADEDYELAARLRDEIRHLEGHESSISEV
ncbi:MAG: UvrB/UvrC motif-containing protein [bacterium]